MSHHRDGYGNRGGAMDGQRHGYPSYEGPPQYEDQQDDHREPPQYGFQLDDLREPPKYGGQRGGYGRPPPRYRGQRGGYGGAPQYGGQRGGFGEPPPQYGSQRLGDGGPPQYEGQRRGHEGPPPQYGGQRLGDGGPPQYGGQRDSYRAQMQDDMIAIVTAELGRRRRDDAERLARIQRTAADIEARRQRLGERRPQDAHQATAWRERYNAAD